MLRIHKLIGNTFAMNLSKLLFGSLLSISIHSQYYAKNKMVSFKCLFAYSDNCLRVRRAYFIPISNRHIRSHQQNNLYSSGAKGMLNRK